MSAPRPRAVVVGSLSLFLVLFVVLTIELSAASPSVGAQHKKAKPAKEYLEPEVEYVEPKPEPEPEYGYEYEEPEPEYEEVPPVVTSSS